MPEPSKATHKAIRAAADLAHRRELESALQRLARSFADWRAGKIGPFDLSIAVNEFDLGPSRMLFKRYSDSPMLKIAVANAVNAGILKLEEVGRPARDQISALAERLR